MTVEPLTDHPAKFSDPILNVLQRLVSKELRRRREHRAGFQNLWLVDPFAGVGRVHQLARTARSATGYNVTTTGVEIEPEWAATHARTVCADSMVWLPKLGMRGEAILAPPSRSVADMRPAGVPVWVCREAGPRRVYVDMFVTSPTYGNRMADHHEAKDDSTRHGYRFSLGRMPTDGSSAVMAWGADYWEFHAAAYRAMAIAAAPGAPLLLNVSNFYRGKELVRAVDWHRGAALGAGWMVDRTTRTVMVPTRRHRHGQNWEARDTAEYVLAFRRPSPW